jgi:RNA polymerase sigma-70 factor (ECF subfamily)
MAKLIEGDSTKDDEPSEVEADDPAQRRRLELFHEHRSLLFSIAYRMLGTVADAEDKIQETFLRWQRVSIADIKSPRAFLVTIVSRLCISHLQSAHVQREEYFGQWLPEPLLTDHDHDPSAALAMEESLSMGFLVLLERLTPVERAVFLLREVFEYEYEEVGRITHLTEVNCRQILRRARQRITEGRPRFDPSPEKQDELLTQFLGATVNGDMNGLISLLAKDIVLYTDGGGKTTAVPQPVYGPTNVARLLSMALKKFAENVVIRRAQINGQPGILGYINGIAETAVIVDIAAGRIQNVYIVRNPDKLTRVPLLSTEFVC